MAFYEKYNLSTAATAAIKHNGYIIYSDATGTYMYNALDGSVEQELLYESTAVPNVTSFVASGEFVYCCDLSYIYKINMRTKTIDYRRDSTVLDIGATVETIIGAPGNDYIHVFEKGSLNKTTNNKLFKTAVSGIDIVRKRGTDTIVFDSTSGVLAVKPVTTGRKIEYANGTVVGLHVTKTQYHVVTTTEFIVLDKALQEVEVIQLDIEPMYAVFNAGEWLICTATTLYVYSDYSLDSAESGSTKTPQVTNDNVFSFGADSGQFKTSVDETIKVVKVKVSPNAKVTK